MSKGVKKLDTYLRQAGENYTNINEGIRIRTAELYVLGFTLYDVFMTPKKILKWIIIFAVFAVPLVPVIVSGNQFFPFITGKNMLFRVLVEIMFVAWLALSLRDVNYRPKKSLLIYALVIFTLIIGLADMFAINAGKAFWSNFERMEGWVTILHLAMYFVVLGHFFKESVWWERFFKMSLGVATYISLYSIIQYMGFITINQGGVRVDATLGNATYLAIYIMFHIFFALILAIKSGGKKISSNIFWWLTGGTGFAFFILSLILARGGLSGDGKMLGISFLISVLAVTFFILSKFKSVAWLYGGLGLLYTFILYLTATRGAAVGLVVGISLVALLVAIFGKSEKKLRKVAVGAIVSIVVVLSVFALAKDNPAIRNHQIMGRFASISYDEFRNSARYMVWGMAIEGFKEKPILGWGQENFNYVFNKHYNPGMYGQEQWFDRTHNVIFDWLISGGILGLLSYLALYVFALYLLWFRENSFSFLEKSAITGLLGAHFVHNLFVFDNIASYIFFFAILAYIHSQIAKPIQRFTKVETETSDSGMSRFVLPFSLLALCIIIYLFNFKAYASSTTLIDTLRNSGDPAAFIENFKKTLAYESLGQAEIRERIVDSVPTIQNSDAPIEMKQAYFDLGKTELEKQLEETPLDARYQFFASIFYGNYGRLDEALLHAEKARELSPKKQSILYHLSRVYLMKGEADKALEVIKEAYELLPENMEALRYYVITAIYVEDYELAESLLISAYEKKAIPDRSIAETYIEKGLHLKAFPFFEELIVAEPKNIEHFTRYIDLSLAIGDRTRAINLLKKVKDIDPKYEADADNYIRQLESGGTISN